MSVPTENSVRLAGRSVTDEPILARANVYRLLGRLWFRELTVAELEVLGSPPVRDALTEIGLTPPPATTEDAQQLAADYCQLFLGPKGHRPPVQSVWCDGQFQGRAAQSMTHYLELLARMDGAWRNSNLLDHLGVQLDAAGAVLQESAASDDEARTVTLEISKSLFENHLDWTEPLTAWVASQAVSPFYRQLADVTRRFLNDERDAFSRS